MFHKKIVFLSVKASVLMLSLILLVPAQSCFALEPIVPVDSNSAQQKQPRELPEMEIPTQDFGNITMESIPPAASAGKSEEASPPDAKPELLPEEPMESEQSADMVSTFTELTQWMESHVETGGTVRLKNDILVEEDEHYVYQGGSPGDPTLFIDVGECTIYVRGYLELQPHLDFSGTGGKKGIFHVEQGGYLDLISITSGGSWESYESYVSVSAEGCAVYQEEGAFFGCYTDKIKGDIHYASLPVAWPFSDVFETYGKIEDLPVVVLPLNGEIDKTVFPQTIPSYLCKDGRHEYKKHHLPVIWNLEEFEEQFVARERFLLTGTYTGEVAEMVAPACLVTFLREDASVFLQCSASKKTEQKLSFAMLVKLDDPSMEHRLEWSVDGENWQRAKEEDIDDEWTEGDEYQFWWQEEADGVVRYDGSFNMEELPRYFSIATIDSQGHATYSDTVFLDGKGKVAGWDNGGGRNGETNPGDPDDDELPPVTSPPVKPPREPSPPDDTVPPKEPIQPPDEIIPPTEPTMPPENMDDREVIGDEHTTARDDYGTGSLGSENPQSREKKAGTLAKDSPAGRALPGEEVPQGTLAESKPVGQPQLDKETSDVLIGQQSSQEGDEELSVSASAVASGTKVRSIAAAIAMIALIGAPVYLTPVWKKLWKRIKLRKHPK